MKHAIQRVEWKDHGDVAGELLRHTFPCSPTARYAWLHEHNPAGSGALWLARAADGRPVGTAAIHARRIIVDRRSYRAGQASDFAVEPAARGFGPAMALQRAVVAACESGEFDFLYGFPNHASKTVFERIGYHLGKTRRLARPLRTRYYLQRSGLMASLARPLATPLDLAIRVVAWETYGSMPRGTRLESLETFDEAFDAFWGRLRTRHAVIADRDRDFMNWRYAQCPTRRYEVAALRRGAEIVATIVWYRIDDVVHVADLLAPDRESFDGLLVAFLRAQRRAGADAVSLILLGAAPFAARLAKYGFFGREVEGAMMVYVPPASPLRGRLEDFDRWGLFEGDVL